jgi:hypothetical protein
MFGAARTRESFERSVNGVKPVPLPIGQAVLQKVVEKLGGLYAAAVQLGVSPRVISHYLDGTTRVPDALLLRAVDIVLDEFQQSPSGASQPFDRSHQ